MKVNFLFLITLFCNISIIDASGGYTNGSAAGKGNLDIDLTWNPFNYIKNGQTYAVVSFGLTKTFDIHGYYSIPTNGPENYYLGIFHQFYKNKFLSLATAVGFRKYNNSSEMHLFSPQLLYTLKLKNNLRLGGSFVSIRNINNFFKVKGTTADIALSIPITKYIKSFPKIDSIDFTIGFFRPALWKPNTGAWHPTYSFDIKFILFN